MFGYFIFTYVSLSPSAGLAFTGEGVMRLWIATGLLVLGGAAHAGQADVCYSANATGDAPDRLTSATVLDCPQAGHRTLAQLASAGWSVAAVQPVVADYAVDPATHTPRSSTAWMVVVQKESR
jgi:hypothetical protein